MISEDIPEPSAEDRAALVPDVSAADRAALDGDLSDLGTLDAELKAFDRELVYFALAGKVGRTVLQAALVGLASAAGVAAGGAPGGALGAAVAKGVAGLAPQVTEKLSKAIEKALERTER